MREVEEEYCFEINVGDVREVDTGEDGKGTGDKGERNMEVMESGTQRGALILADPMAEGVSEVKQAPVGGLEQDIG